MVSIIIPVYNTPVDLLDRCLKSIFRNTENEVEVIIVNDGSKSVTPEAYDKVAADHSNVVICHTENQGVSAARNKGMESARGKYVAFIDGDDEVSSDFIDHSVRYAEEYSADLVIGRLRFEPGEKILQGTKEITVLNEDEIQYIKRSLLDIKQDRIPGRILGSPCGRLYRLDIAKDIGFVPGLAIMEDQIFNREYLDLSKRVVLVPEDWYIYYQNDFSAMHTYEKDYLGKMKPYWKEYNRLCKNETDQRIRDILDGRILQFYTAAVRKTVNTRKMKLKKRLKVIKEIANETVFRELPERFSYKKVKGRKSKIIYLCLRYRLYFVIDLYNYMIQRKH